MKYRLVSDETTTFNKAASVEHRTPEFGVRLEDGVATFSMTAHYPAIHLAKRSLEPYIEAWEVQAALECGQREIRFEFEDADVVDRDPPGPGEPQIGRVHGVL